VAAFRERGKDLLDRHVLFDILPDDLATEKERKRYQLVHKATEALPSLPDGMSRFKAPITVRVSVDRTAKDDALVLHCVNYARQKDAPKRGKGGADEKPIAVEQ